MKRKSVLRSDESGFTLVEIIAVLVILGILSAVAAPKFFDFQDEAKAASARSAISEVKARFSLGLADYLVAEGGEPSAITDICTHVGADVLPASCSGTVPAMGDFDVSISVADDVATITVNSINGDTVSSDNTGTWELLTN